MDNPSGFSGAGRHRRAGGAAPEPAAGTPAASSCRASSARSSTPCLAVVGRPGPPRRVLPDRLRGQRPGRRRAAPRSCPAAGDRSGGFRASGFMEWLLPFSAPSAATWIAMYAQRHFHEFGTTREQLAQIALNAREERRGEPEGDLPRPDVDGRLHRGPHDLVAAVPLRLRRPLRRRHGGHRVAARHRAATCARPRSRVEAVGTAFDGRPAGTAYYDLTTMACQDAGAQLLDPHRPETGRRAARRDVRRLLVHHHVLARGDAVLRPRREAARSSRAGRASPATAGCPLNTHGGQLSAGRLHGFGFLHEVHAAVGRGRGPPGPGRPEVGVAAAGGGNTCGCLLLVREEVRPAPQRLNRDASTRRLVFVRHRHPPLAFQLELTAGHRRTIAWRAHPRTGGPARAGRRDDVARRRYARPVRRTPTAAPGSTCGRRPVGRGTQSIAMRASSARCSDVLPSDTDSDRSRL